MFIAAGFEVPPIISNVSCCSVATACLREGVLAEHGTVSQYLSTKMGTKDFGSAFDLVSVT